MEVANFLHKLNIKYNIISPPASQNFFKKNNLSYLTFSQISNFPKIPKLFITLFGKLMDKSVTNYTLYKDSYYYLGNSLLDTINLLMKGDYNLFFDNYKVQNNWSILETIQFLYDKYNRQFLLPIYTMENILRKLQPDLVITTNSPRSERAMQIAAIKHNIPCISFTDAFGTTEQYSITSNYIIAANSITKENLILNNMDKNKIIIGGNPILEKIQTSNNSLALEYITKHKKNNFIKNIFVPFSLSRFDIQSYNDICKIIRIASKKYENFLFILKFHPGEDNKEVFNSKNILILPDTLDSHSFLHLANKTIVSHSMAGIERAIINKSCIIYTSHKKSILSKIKIKNFSFTNSIPKAVELLNEQSKIYNNDSLKIRPGYKTILYNLLIKHNIIPPWVSKS